MLPAAHRLVDPDKFRETVRLGKRAGGRTLVVHLHESAEAGPVRIGFVVSKAVGPAVVRNRVKRRLRHLAREQLSVMETRFPGSAVLVVRALPTAATAGRAELAADLARSLERVLR